MREVLLERGCRFSATQVVVHFAVVEPRVLVGLGDERGVLEVSQNRRVLPALWRCGERLIDGTESFQSRVGRLFDETGLEHARGHFVLGNEGLRVLVRGSELWETCS